MSSKKRVLMLVYTFAPDDPRVMNEARTATHLGYEVHTIGIAFSAGTSGDHSKDDIRIDVVPVICKLSQIPGALYHIILGYVPEAPVSSQYSPHSNALSILFFFLWIMRLTLFSRYDLIHAHEHQAMPIGWFLSLLKRIPWIYDAHEHVPGNRKNFQTLKANLAIRTEAFFIQRADIVITVGKRLANDLLKRGVQEIVVIGNWKPLTRYNIDVQKIEEKKQQDNLNRFSLLVSYFGVLNEERQIDVLLETIKQTPQIGYLLAGKGDLREEMIQLARSQPNLIWLDWIPLDEVPLYTSLCDVIYACLKPVSGNPEYMAPNKLFDAFAAGKALIARRGLGEIGEILEEEQAGILLDEVTPETVRDALLKLSEDRDLLRQLQKNAHAASERYNWDVAEIRLQELYTRLTS